MTATDGAALQEKFHALVRRQQDKLTLPWLGTTLAIGIYSIVLTLFADDGPREVRSAVRYSLTGAGFVLALAALVVPRRMLSDKKVAERMREQPDAPTLSIRMQLGADDYQVAKELTKPLLRLLGLTTSFRVPYFVALGLSESVALVGLAAGFLAATVTAAAPFFLVSFALHGVHFPRLQPLLDRGRKLDQPDEVFKELSRTLDKMDLAIPALAQPRPSRTTGEKQVQPARRPSRTTGENVTRPVSERPPPRTKP